MDSDFLKDIIPYRCPKCGDSRKFTSLRDLKLHLNAEHAFKVGCVKPRTRTSLFDHKGHNSKKKDANRDNLSRQWSSSYDSRRSSSESYERESPVLQSYREEAKMLERRLEAAREMERYNRRGHYLSRSQSYDPLDSTVHKLNKDIMNSRKSQWQSSDALYKAEEVINGVETAAEERLQNQQHIIQNLVENLQQRDRQLINANRNLEALQNDRDKLMNEIEDIFKSADFGNKKLLQELETKEKELSCVNDELNYLKKKSSEELKQKDDKLIEAEKSLRQLEHDRKTLEGERENLMEKVQMDSGLLRKTLEMKENQVRKLQMEMESMKHEQENLLSESMELYNTADKGTSKLKDLMKLRDRQLREAEHELDRLKQINECLVWESKQLTEQADSHSQILHEMLRQREDELEAARQDLQYALQSDNPKSVNQQIGQLQLIILEKTALLEQKEKELQSLKTFLTSTAEKEAVAREKLEKFISDLIDRADKAEKELDYLKNYITANKSDSKNLGKLKDNKESGKDVRNAGKFNDYSESGADDSDSDDEMSEDTTEDVKRPKPILRKSESILKRQAPVQKRKEGYHGNMKYQSPNRTFPKSPSMCDSGYHDSKLSSPRNNLMSSHQKPDNMQDMNLPSNLRTSESSPYISHNLQHNQVQDYPYYNALEQTQSMPDISSRSNELYNDQRLQDQNFPENTNYSFHKKARDHRSRSPTGTMNTMRSISYDDTLVGPMSDDSFVYIPSVHGNHPEEVKSKYYSMPHQFIDPVEVKSKYYSMPHHSLVLLLVALCLVLIESLICNNPIVKLKNWVFADCIENVLLSHKRKILHEESLHHSFNPYGIGMYRDDSVPSPLSPDRHYQVRDEGLQQDNSISTSEYLAMPAKTLTKRLQSSSDGYPKADQYDKTQSYSSSSRQPLPESRGLDVSGSPGQFLTNRGNVQSLSSSERQTLSGRPLKNELSSSERQALPNRSMNHQLSSSERQAQPNRSMNHQLSSSERQAQPNRSMNHQLSSSERQELPNRSMNYQLSSSERQTLPSRPLNHQLSSSDRQALPNRSKNYQLSSSERQRLPCQTGDNSLSDVLSITDYEPPSNENNSFQRIMDENGILWDGDFSCKQKVYPQQRMVPKYNDKQYVQKPYSAPRLKLSEKFSEERKLFSENIKRMMKLPFMRESGNQAELTEDTLRYHLQKESSGDRRNTTHSLKNVYPISTDKAKGRQFESEDSTKDTSTQTWIIDRNLMEPDQGDNSTSQFNSSSYKGSHSSPDQNCMPYEEGGYSTSQSVGDLMSCEDNSTSYSKLPQDKFISPERNLNMPKQLNQTSKNNFNQATNEKPEVKYCDKNEKPRDLFEELKKESMNENVSFLVPENAHTYLEQKNNANEKPDNLQAGNFESFPVVKPVAVKPFVNESSADVEKQRTLNRVKPNIDNQVNIENVPQIVDKNKIDNNSTNLLSGREVDISEQLVSTSPDFMNLQTTTSIMKNSKGNQHEPELSTNDSLAILSPQKSDDNVDTDEEIDSVIYDKSTDSVNGILSTENSQLIYRENDSITSGKPDMQSQQEVITSADRRKSLSRQLSVDVRQSAENNLPQQLVGSNEGKMPLGLMVEETLTPESLDKSFFAQPDTEIEEEYPQSVCSMDGFTLSRSSSQDSLLSERLSHYSKREVTRKRRQALCHVFSFLDTASLIQTALVCREWKKISRHPSLWKHVFLRNQKCSVQFLLNIAKWCTSMQTLHLEGIVTRDQKEFESKEEYNVKTRAILEPGLEKLLQVSESTLKTAAIIHCENVITDKGLWLVSCYSRMVRNVTYICNLDLPGADVIWALGAGCRDITYLNITLSDPSSAVGVKFNNKCLQVISQFCQDLKTLCIGGTEVDINGLVLIAKSCQRLTGLELHYCTTVTEDTMVALCRLGLNSLKYVIFNFTPVEAKAILHLCKSSKQLRKIKISLDISCFDLKSEIKEEERMKTYADMVKNLKELEKKPGVGNILKLNCGEVFINNEKKFFGLF